MSCWQTAELPTPTCCVRCCGTAGCSCQLYPVSCRSCHWQERRGPRLPGNGRSASVKRSLGASSDQSVQATPRQQQSVEAITSPASAPQVQCNARCVLTGTTERNNKPCPVVCRAGPCNAVPLAITSMLLVAAVPSSWRLKLKDSEKFLACQPRQGAPGIESCCSNSYGQSCIRPCSNASGVFECQVGYLRHVHTAQPINAEASNLCGAGCSVF